MENFTKSRNQDYYRKSVHTIEEVYEAVKEVLFVLKKSEARVLFYGDMIKGNSQRLQTFFTSGTRCVLWFRGAVFCKREVQ